MIVEFHINEAADGYALEMATAAGGDGEMLRIQSGYRTPLQAMQALLDALTIAPPDLTIYDEAIGKIGQLVDASAEADQQIGNLVERVGNCEEAIQTLLPPPVAAPARRVNPLLAGREAAQAHVVPPAAQGPPALRQPRPVIPHQPSGGVVGKYRSEDV